MKMLFLFALPLLAVEDPYSYMRAGSADDVLTTGTGGTVLMGGGRDVDAAFGWMIDGSGNGDVLVLRARGMDAYNPYILKQGAANSAATLIVRSREAAGDEFVVDKIRHAEAVQERIDAGYPVGGTSAGLAVLGEYYFSAEFDTVTSAEAMADPESKKVALGRDFLKIRHLENLITDSHFTAREREGRLEVFMKKIGVAAIVGLGIDEATAVLLSADGRAKVVGKGKAHVHAPGKPPRHFAAGEAVLFR